MGRVEGQRARRRDVRRGGQRRKKGIRRFFTWKKVLGAFFGLCLLAMGGLYVLHLMVPIPEANAMAKRENNIYKYADGKVLARAGQVNRDIVGLDKIPEPVQKTFVASENKSFYEDSGVDFKGITRALWNTLSGRGKQGGSTITQQYVKNYYLNQDQTVTRKLKELVISSKVDQRFSKDEILAGYINTSYFGRGAYGIQAAAQEYYGVDSTQLTVEQGAYLAAVLQAPSQYDWAVATDTGKKLVTDRWNYVLDNMVKMKELDAGQRAGMKFPTPVEAKPAAGLGGQNGYLVQAANAEMRRQGVSDQELQQGGWTITLNIDRKKQKLLEDAVVKELTRRLDPAKRKVDADIQAGAVSVDPNNGEILALYGGQDFAKHQLSNATNTTYQPASTFKPAILAAAFNAGSRTQDGKPITADTIYNGDTERPVKGPGGNGYAPPNEDDISYGPITVQKAMDESVNTVFAQMGVDVGLDQVQDDAYELGMADIKGQKAHPAITLGSYGASPMQMAGVYATLANHGEKVTPTIIKEAQHPTRSYSPQRAIGDQVISREAADGVTSVLTGVVNDGTAKESVRDAPDRGGRQVAGKTGTSDDNKSAWFVGYTPNLVTSVGLWGQAAEPREVKVDGKKVTVPKGGQVTISGTAGADGRISGGSYPARIWAAYAFDAVRGDHAKFDLEADQGSGAEPTPTITDTPEDPLPPRTPDSIPTPTPPPNTPSTPPNNPPTPPTNPPTETPPGRPTGGPTGPTHNPPVDPPPGGN